MSRQDGIVVRKWVGYGTARKEAARVPCLTDLGAAGVVTAMLTDGFYGGYSITVERGMFDLDGADVEESMYRPDEQEHS